MASNFCKILRGYEIAKLENDLLRWLSLSVKKIIEIKPELLKIYKSILNKWDADAEQQLISEYLG